jgi:hypothetical protein
VAKGVVGLAAKQHAELWWYRLVAPTEEEAAAVTARGRAARVGDAWLWNAAMVLTAAPPGADARGAATMAAMPVAAAAADGRLILVAESGVVAANVLLGESRGRG